MTKRRADLAATVLQEFPLPIAYEFHHLQELRRQPGGPDTAEECRQLFTLFAYTLRFCTLVMVSDYLQHNPHDQDINRHILDCIDGFKLERHVDILTGIVRRPEPHHSAVFVPQMVDFCLGEVASGSSTTEALRRLAVHHDIVHGSDEKADWFHQYLAEEPEILGLLERLGFLTGYDLLSLNDQYPSDEGYAIEAYVRRGAEVDRRPGAETIMSESHLPPTGLALREHASGALLPLFPLLLRSECPRCRENQEPVSDEVGLFDHRLGETVVYSALRHTAGGPHMIDKKDPEVVKEVYQIEEALRVRRVRDANEANWTRTLDYSQLNVRNKLDELRHKYTPELYAVRELQGRIDLFLHSPERAFALVGDSGCGKTSLLCQLAREWSQPPGRTAPFLIVCSDLPKWAPTEAQGDGPAGESVEFHCYLGEVLGVSAPLPQVLNVLDQSRQGEQVVLLFDAINEYYEPGWLLQQIAKLADGIRHPWVKIILSCRSTTWRHLPVALKPDTFYAAPVEQGWDPAAAEHRLPEFSERELEAAYENHRRQFNLQTPYADLKEQSQSLGLMSDPLMLRIVAEVYHDAAIPPSVESARVFERYIDQTVGTKSGGRLQMDKTPQMLQRDVYEALVDKLVSHDGCGRVKARTEVSVEQLAEDARLHDWVLNLRPSSAYVRLLSTGIFRESKVQEGQRRVGFTYERLAEYVMAERLQDCFEGDASVVELVKQIPDNPLLRGAIQYGLAIFAEDRTLLSLAAMSSLNVQSIVVDAIAQAGREGVRDLRPLVSALERSRDTDQRVTAVRAAYELGNYDVLSRALRSSNKAVRAAGCRETYYVYWARDRAQGRQMVRDLAHQARLYRPGTLISALDLFSRLSENYVADPEGARLAREILAVALRHIPGLAPGRRRGTSQRANRLPRAVRRPLYWAIARFVHDFWMAESKGIANRENNREFFRLDPAQRERVAHLLDLVVWEDADLAHGHEELFQASLMRDVLTTRIATAVMYGLYAGLPESRQDLAKTMDRMFWQDDPLARFVAGDTISRICLKYDGRELYSELSSYVHQLWDKGQAYMEFRGQRYSVISLHRLMTVECKRSGHIACVPTLLRLQQDDESATEIIDSLGIVGAHGYLRPALERLEPWCHTTNPALHDAVVRSLRQMRSTNRDEVDAFLMYHVKSRQLVHEVMEVPSRELLGMFASGHWLEFVLDDRKGRQMAKEGMTKALVQGRDLVDAVAIMAEYFLEHLLDWDIAAAIEEAD